jgi:outer membrane protein assembly factor BamB
MARCDRLGVAAGALTLAWLVAAVVEAQQIPFGFLMQPTQIELTAPHVETIPGTTGARLEQAKQLTAARNWNEAVEIYRELAADMTGRVVALDDTRFISLRNYCHLQIARLPSEGLAAYRRRVDASAEQAYRAGLANRDEHQLRHVVDDWFCSTWGDDALVALGDLALERAGYADARRAWERISPLLCAPDGSPMWLALRDIDLKTKWPEVEKWWGAREKRANWLAYPDTQIDLAEVRARLVLASIRAGELDRAAIELQFFQRMHPNAMGYLGGQRANFAAALQRLLSGARDWPAQPTSNDWPTFAGACSRSVVASPISADLVAVWKEPIRLVPAKYVRAVRLTQSRDSAELAARDDPDAAVHESQRPLSCFPIVWGDAILFADDAGIHAADFRTGKPLITANGLIYRDESDDKGGRAPFGLPGSVGHGVPRLTLDAMDGIVYARAGNPSTFRAQPAQSAGDRIIGLDLRRDGLLSFQSPKEESAWAFDGVPICDGRRIYVAMRRSDVSPREYVACFDAATGVRQWRTPIGAADTISGGNTDEITHNLLTMVGSRIYLNTNLGLVAALDADSGNIEWISQYDRAAGKTFTVGAAVPVHFDRDPAPCVYHDGLLFVAPSDSPAVFALNAETGKTIWQQNRLHDALQLLGVVGKSLIACGDRISSLDVSSGRVRWTWPESDRAGIRGMGRGLLAGNEVFWPTRYAIYVLNPSNGTQTRSPIGLAPLAGGANLAASRGRLVVAGYDKLMVLGAPSAESIQTTEAERTGQFVHPSAVRSNH